MHASKITAAVAACAAVFALDHLSAQVLTHSAAIGGVKQRFKNAQNDPGDAEKQWRVAVDLLQQNIANDTKEKDKEETYFFLGAVYYRMPDYEKAFEAFQKALTFGKKYWEEGDKLTGGISLFSIKESINDMKKKTYNQASKSFNTALTLTVPDSMRKELYRAIDKFQLLFKWDPQITIDDRSFLAGVYATLANAYIQLVNMETEEGNKKGLKEKILENLIKLSELDKKNFSVAYSIFAVYYQDKNYDKSVEWIDRALQIETKDSAMLATRTQLIAQKALIYDVTGKHDAALATYVEAIKSDPNNADLHFNLARLYLDSNKTELALAEFKIVKKLNPKDVLSNYKIANEGYKAYQLKRRAAVEKYASNPKKVADTLKSLIDVTLQDLQDAVDALQNELPAAPDKAESYSIIGTAYNYMAQLAGDLVYDLENKDKIKNQRPYFEKAVESLKKAVELRPANKSAWTQLGTAYLNLQMKKEAEAAFDKAK